MNIDADFRAEILAAEKGREPVRAAFAYLALSIGATLSLSIIPALIAMLAARGFH